MLIKRGYQRASLQLRGGTDAKLVLRSIRLSHCFLNAAAEGVDLWRLISIPYRDLRVLDPLVSRDAAYVRVDVIVCRPAF